MRRMHSVCSIRRSNFAGLTATALVLLSGAGWMIARAQSAPKPDVNVLSKAALAQHAGTIMVRGPDYLTRDTCARLLAFRGDWDEEFRKYHPEGKVIFTSFAAG